MRIKIIIFIFHFDFFTIKYSHKCWKLRKFFKYFIFRLVLRIFTHAFTYLEDSSNVSKLHFSAWIALEDVVAYSEPTGRNLRIHKNFEIIVYKILLNHNYTNFSTTANIFSPPSIPLWLSHVFEYETTSIKGEKMIRQALLFWSCLNTTENVSNCYLLVINDYSLVTYDVLMYNYLVNGSFTSKFVTRPIWRKDWNRVEDFFLCKNHRTIRKKTFI